MRKSQNNLQSVWLLTYLLHCFTCAFSSSAELTLSSFTPHDNLFVLHRVTPGSREASDPSDQRYIHTQLLLRADVRFPSDSVHGVTHPPRRPVSAVGGFLMITQDKRLSPNRSYDAQLGFTEQPDSDTINVRKRVFRHLSGSNTAVGKHVVFGLKHSECHISVRRGGTRWAMWLNEEMTTCRKHISLSLCRAANNETLT